MRILYLIPFLCLAGCIPSLSNSVNLGGADYHSAENNVANQMLLTNILYARDGVPIHFSDLVNIHGSMQFNGQIQASLPIGPLNHATNSRGGVTPQIGIQSNPSFDVNSLDTQPFTNGILSPIDLKDVQYFLNLGVDDRVVLLLFFSGVKLGNSPDALFIPNDPFDERDAKDPNCKRPDGSSCTMFFDYLYRIDELVRERGRFSTNSYHELKPVGPAFRLDMNRGFKVAAGLDPTKYAVEPVDRSPGMYQLFQVSSKVAFCFAKNSAEPIASLVFSGRDNEPSPGLLSNQVCHQAEVKLPSASEQDAKKKTPPIANSDMALTARSVYGMIKFLGDLVRYGDTHSETQNRPSCFTIDDPMNPPEDLKSLCERGNVLFTVSRSADDPSLSVTYENTNYYIGKFDRDDQNCYGTDSPEHVRCDHSSEVLSIVGLLLNLNKSATDLRATPSVVVEP